MEAEAHAPTRLRRPRPEPRASRARRARAEGSAASPIRPGLRPARRAPVCPLWQRPLDAPRARLLVVAALLLLTIGAGALQLVLDAPAAAVRSGLLAGLQPPLGHALGMSALLLAVVGVLRAEARVEARDRMRIGRRLLPRVAVASRPPPLQGLAAAGLLGVLAAPALVAALLWPPAAGLDLAGLSAWMLVLAISGVLGWTGARYAVGSWQQDLAYARLVRGLRQVDVLDVNPFRVFGRRALRRAVEGVGLALFASALCLDAGAPAVGAALGTVLLVPGWCCCLGPVWALHARIRAEKKRELRVLRHEIERERKRLRACGWRPAEAGARFASLLAYEERLDAAGTWPMTLATRLCLALLVPGSLAACLVLALVAPAALHLAG